MIKHNSLPKFIFILKFTATPSPRHPTTFPVLPVLPEFSKASDSQSIILLLLASSELLVYIIFYTCQLSKSQNNYTLRHH